ncbi:SDR family NAD(P)-dependent oxidoreductase [Streptomyces sp. NPDC001165]|uniref:SDR family NAD(P)-dependent oxidoreductase n=1 Tax=Streptomyces sp. NPDC001165 TaxID=3364546 RepID=UPI003681BB82
MVTGGGSGIGRASALALAAEGAIVTVAGRTQDTLKEMRRIEAAGGTARFVLTDISRGPDVDRAVDKAAVISMTKSTALEAAAHGIRVNAVAPGLVETPVIASMDPDTDPMKSIIAAHPMGRIARAEKIADAVVRLSSKRSSFVTGAVIPVDGGYTVP